MVTVEFAVEEDVKGTLVGVFRFLDQASRGLKLKLELV